MSDFTDQILPANGGLNYDDDPRFFENGDTDYRLNVIPTALGDTYVLTNIKGTTQKSHGFTHDATYDGATYTPLGACYDVQRNAVYFLLYSDLTNHCILRYNIDDDDFDKIVWDNPNIGLDSDYPITDAFMIGDWLYWNPRSSSPRAINVEWAYYNYIASPVTETVPTSDWSIGDYCEFRGKVYQATAVVDTGTVPITNPEYYDFVGWSYADNNFSYRNRYFFNTPFQPAARIGAEFLDTSSVKYNKVWGKPFQFTYRYYVPELGVSSAAPFSDVIANFEGEIFNGEYVGDVTRNNRIRLQVPLFILEDDSNGRADWLFSRVDVMFREGEDARWKLIRSLTHDEVYSSGTDEYFTVDFYNDGTYQVLDDAEIEKPYNYLPREANSQWSIDGERCSYGGVTEGYDPPPIEVTTSNGIEEIALVPSEDEAQLAAYTLSVNDTKTRYDRYGNPIAFFYESSTISVVAGVTVGDVIVAVMDGERFTGTVTDISTATTLTDDFVSVVDKSSYYARTQSGPIISVGSSTPSMDITIYIYDSSISLDSIYKSPTFKSGDHHPLCLFYWDEIGRRSDPIYNEDLRVYTPFLPEYHQQITVVADLGGAPNEVRITCSSHGYTAGDSVQIKDTTNYDGTYTITNVNSVNTFDIESAYVAETFGDASAVTSIISTNYRNYINWEIAHEPPSYAEQWGFGYAGRATVADFIQFNVYSMAVGTGIYSDYVGVNISGLQDLRNNNSGNLDISLPNSRLDAYQFEEGDRLRIITEADSAAASYDELSTDNWTEYTRDYEVKAFDPTTDTVYIDVEIANATFVAAYNDNSVFIELFTPKEASDTLIFHEIGQRYGIYTDSGNRYHRGASQDQSDYDGTTPATGKVTSGDCYVITRAFGVTPGSFDDNETAFVESPAWSDYYPSEIWGKGKIGFDSGIGEAELNNIRYGNKYNPKTGVSGVGTFDGLDYISLSYNYGDIAAIRQIGNVFKVLFENNVASVLVNRTQFYDADGQSQIVKSDNVLGSVNYSEEMWGTVNPESVTVVDRNLYFWDLIRKAYIRNAPNGSFPVSDYKMRKYFIDKADALLTSGKSNFSVFSAWDDDHDLMYVGFQDDINPNNCEYVLFHEPSNRWVAFASPRSLTSSNLVSFDDDGISTDVGDLVELLIATTYTGGTYTSTVDVDVSAGNWSDDESFNASNAYTLYPGDTVSISLEQTTESQSLDGIVYFNIIGTGSVSNVSTEVSTTNGSPYTNTITITENSTIQVQVQVSGDQQAVVGNEMVFDWSLDITRKSVPSMHHTPSALLSFTDEDVHLHNDNDTRCNLFGVQETYTARVYGVGNPNIIKIFEAIALHTNKYWDISDIQIPATLNYPNGMQSKIPEGRFEKEEGVLRSDYLCNMKSTSATANIPDLLNGDNLRGYIIYHDLDGDETVEHTLFKVDILSSISKY